MILEAVGAVVGAGSRLLMHRMESSDKQKERDHEFRMVDKEIEAQRNAAQADMAVRQVEAGARIDVAELQALQSAIESQAKEAMAAGGWAAWLSATFRPISSYLLLINYSAYKLTLLSMAIMERASLLQISGVLFTEYDGSLLSSILSFWFLDRSIRKSQGKV